MLTKERILNLVGDFYWGYGAEYFIRVDTLDRKGQPKEYKFIWSCPSCIGGDNTIRSYQSSYEDWLLEQQIPQAEYKGESLIKEVTTEDVIFTEEP